MQYPRQRRIRPLGAAIATSLFLVASSASSASAGTIQSNPQIFPVPLPQAALLQPPGDLTDNGVGEEAPTGDPTEGGIIADPGGLGSMTKKVNANIDIALQLKKVEIVKFDPDDAEDEFIEFLFGTKVLEIYEPSAFKLIGVSSTEVVSGIDVLRDEKNPNALLVAFPSGVDPTDYPLAAVAPGAVGSIKGEVNPGDSQVLIGSKTKDSLATAVPKLVNVQVEPSLERILYQFDQKLDETGADPLSFGYYSLEGQLHKAAAITSVNDKTVIAKFDEQGGDQVEEAVRAVVLSGAVRDKSGLPNPIGSIGAFTTSPDLVEVYNGPARTQFDFLFDKDVTRPRARDFNVYTRLGKPYPAVDARLVGSNVVRVTVPAVREFDDEVVFGTVQPGAVSGDAGFDTPSTLGGTVLTKSKQKKDDVGFVAGPELTNVQLDAKGSMVKFFFDEKVDDDQKADPSDFSLITKSGTVVTGATFVDADLNWVIITFEPAAIKAASSAMVVAGAVVDFEGNPNPPDIYS